MSRAHPSLADRLQVELVRLREEAGGHPEDCATADAAAIARGGDLIERVHTRAQALPDADALRSGIDAVLLSGRLLAGAVLLLAALAGAGAASAALDATQPTNIPLVLLVLVGFNLATLLLWLGLQVRSPRIPPGVGSALRALWRRLAARIAGAGAAPAASMQLFGTGPIARWLFATLVHAAWLGFSLAALLTLALLLSVRSYELSWQTTLLSHESLAAWAHGLRWWPSALGLSGQPLSIDDTGSAAARQAWAQWLLAAVAAYGVLPRLVALIASASLLWRAQALLGRDLSRPGLARLRERLLPDHRRLGVTDPAVAPSTELPASAPMPHAELPRGAVHALALETDDCAPALAGIDWVWLGAVDDPASRELVLRRLREEKVAALAVVVRATLTPDRGVERFVGELAAAARAPSFVVLSQIERLQARGAETARARIDDWRGLARRAGASGAVVAPAVPDRPAVEAQG